MKQISKFIVLAIVMIAFSASAMAQVSATATASATIVTPIAIVNASNMNFGNIAVSAAPGTVVLPAAAVPVRTVTGGCTLPATAGTVSAAAFTVTGSAAFTYSITLPANASLTGPGAPMTANAFVSSPTVAAGGLLSAGGNQTLYVGATLNVAGAQVAGAYTTVAPFTVTVNYN
jgi:hypothetical protein